MLTHYYSYLAWFCNNFFKVELYINKCNWSCMTWKIKIDRPSTTTSWCIKNVFFCIMSKILIIFSWIVDVYLIHFFSLIKNYTSHLLLFTDTLYVKVWETTLYWYIVCQGMGDYSVLIHCMSRYGRLLFTDTLYVKVWEIWRNHITGQMIDLLCLMPLSAISWRLDLVVEDTGVPGENHRPWASNW